MALASAVLDGGVVVKALLIAGLWLAGWGAARLAPPCCPTPGRPASASRSPSRSGIPMSRNGFCKGTGACWWATAACPGWRRRCCGCVRRRTHRWAGVCALLFWMALAGLTPTGLMLAATVALTCVFAPGTGGRGGSVRRWAWRGGARGAAVADSQPRWPTRCRHHRPRGCRRSRRARSRASARWAAWPVSGVSGTLRPYPPRGQRFSRVVAAVVLLGIVASGVAGGAAPTGRRAAARPGGCRCGGARGDGDRPGAGVGRGADPGAARTRRGARRAEMGGAGGARLRAGRRGRGRHAAAPASGRGDGGDLLRGADRRRCPTWHGVWAARCPPVQYPPGWAAAAAMINADPRPVAVLPVGSMRRFAWAAMSPVLDPLPRWVRADVLTTGDLTIGGRTVPGEGDRAREVQQLLLTGADREVADAGRRLGGRRILGCNRRLWRSQWPIATSDLAVYRIGGDHPQASVGDRAGRTGRGSSGCSSLCGSTLGRGRV